MPPARMVGSWFQPTEPNSQNLPRRVATPEIRRDELWSNCFQNAKHREISGVGRKQAANAIGVKNGGKLGVEDAFAP